MKDEKFNELMEKYVDSTTCGQDTDLKKYRDRNQDAIKARRRIPKYVWATCAVLVVIIVSLSIALPIVLNKDDGSNYYYCDMEDVDRTKVGELSEFIDGYNFSCLLPSIEFIYSQLYGLINKNDKKEIGALIILSVFDENFDEITFNVIKKPYVLKGLESFNGLTDSVQWRNTTVRYKISNSIYNESYFYEIAFTIGKYNYFINFDTYNAMSITQALDLIY